MDLEEIVKKSAGNDKDKGIFNNAGQVWNHNFYWESMAPKGGAPDATATPRQRGRATSATTIEAGTSALAVARKERLWATMAPVKAGRPHMPGTDMNI